MRKRSWTSGVLAAYLIEAWWNCGKLPGHVWIAVSDMQLEISHSIWDIWATKMMKKYGKIVSKHPQAMSLNTISQVRLANATRSHNQSCRSQQHLLLKQMCLYVSVVFRWFQLLQHEWIFDVRDSMNSIYNYTYLIYLDFRVALTQLRHILPSKRIHPSKAMTRQARLLQMNRSTQFVHTKSNLINTALLLLFMVK